jgi:hypothetical protein
LADVLALFARRNELEHVNSWNARYLRGRIYSICMRKSMAVVIYGVSVDLRKRSRSWDLNQRRIVSQVELVSPSSSDFRGSEELSENIKL